LIVSLPSTPTLRREWLQRQADILRHWQHRNRQARVSHVKRRLQKLEAAGITVAKLPRCRSG